jgi:hypothetical protein
MKTRIAWLPTTMHPLAKRIARHLAAILNEPVYIYSLNSLLYKGVVRPRAEHTHRSFWTRLMP